MTVERAQGGEEPEDLVPLSAHQHWAYCPRQCALIHVEGQWGENLYTAEGKQLHSRADSGSGEWREGVWTARAVALSSRSLGVSGRADTVEFRPAEPPAGVRRRVGGRDGNWVPYPVEYKRGRPKKGHRGDEIQLCAQALCLEEMLEVAVPEGALFYGKTRRRKEVVFDAELRALTREAAREVRALLDERRVPEAELGPKCERCSLFAVCRPDASRSAGAYVHRRVAALLADDHDASERAP